MINAANLPSGTCLQAIIELLSCPIMTQVSGKIATLDRMIWFGEASLRKGITEFMAHYHQERNHQGLNNRLIISDDASRNVAA